MIGILALLLFGPPVEIQVVAKQWLWKFQHPEGRREINELHVPVGYPVELRMTSEDVPHALAIPAFRLKKFLFRGRETRLTFLAKRKGEYDFHCAARCGAYNSKMRGKVIAMEVRDYLQWARGEVPGESPLAAGRRLYASLKCEACHRPDGAGRGPSLGALFGRTVTLRDGGTVLAGEDYIRESILDPSAKVVAGYEPVMPSFQGRLTEGQIRALLTFLRALEGGSP